MDTKQCVSTLQHFGVPIFEVEHVVWGYGCGVCGDPSSELSATVKSERVPMVMDGDLVTGIAGTGSVSVPVTRSARGG